MPVPSRKDKANAIRFLSMDAVQKANSGHPGMPMGMADIAEVLWQDFLTHNPRNPQWVNRDRFVLSNGHGCMLHYALLHLSGYDLTIDDLKAFRQLHSRTPGHPEYGLTPGVETTTGPLGQGLANAVGMAIAEKHLAAVFNRPEFPIIDHFVYCFVGDGCLMEGISHEACSLAGTLGLNKLIVFYDDNRISIDGDVRGWFTDNTPERFAAYGWQVIPKVDGHDSEALHAAIQKARACPDRPTIICCDTTIGWGSPNMAGTAATHGAALGDTEIVAVRSHLSWEHIPFVIPTEIYGAWNACEKGQRSEQAWQTLFDAYAKQYPELAKEFIRRTSGEFPTQWAHTVAEFLQTLNDKKQSIATRKASQQCLNKYAQLLPEMMGGSADLTESNCTNWEGMQLFTPQTPAGRYIHYGVREFGMSAIMNGIALSKAIIPFGGTFLTFSDYARNAIRLASLMRQRVIFVYTHDSIGLGEDGPTHQPIEHLPSLRLMPGLSTWRPCDTVETAVAWQQALEHQGPTCLLFSRQNVPHQERTSEQIDLIKKGGYVLADYSQSGQPDALLIATGSEVGLAMASAKQLQAEKIYVRVISMPSTNVFLAQEAAYQQSVLPEAVQARVIIEAAATATWYQFAGTKGKIIGMDTFGDSAPAKDVFREHGFTVENIIAKTKESIYAATENAQNYASKCALGK